MPTPERRAARSILLTGGSGYVGGRLIPCSNSGRGLRCLARDPEKLRARPRRRPRSCRGTFSIRPRWTGAAGRPYRLLPRPPDVRVRSKDFEREDRQAARNSPGPPEQAGVRRIIYLGGLGDDADPELSPHLRSRHEVGEILRDSGVETIEFRASMVIGAGSLSFELMKSLTDRLPVMLCPRWLTTPTQPIAVDDVLATSWRRGLASGREPDLRDRRSRMSRPTAT